MSLHPKTDIFSAKLFHDQLIAYMEEYAAYLLLVKSDPAVISKRVVLQQFINYLFNEHLVANLNEISQEILDFGNLPKDEYPDLTSNTPPGLILATLGSFFEFLYGKYGIESFLVKGAASALISKKSSTQNESKTKPTQKK